MNWDNFKEIFADCELLGDKILIKSRLHEVIEFIANNYPYDMLKQIIGIHNEDGQIELIYHLYSTIDEENLSISYITTNEADSIVDIFKSAQADENEIYDLFGVNFLGNEDLKRLYMPDSWKGHPLRKDYVQDDERLEWNSDENNNA